GILIVVFSVILIVVLIASFSLRPAESVPTATSTLLPTITYTPDPCAQANIQGTVNDFDKLSREFNDAFEIAKITPAYQLTPIISELQRIRRAAEDYVVPSCLKTLKQHQLDFMNTAINITFVLYQASGGSPNTTLTQDQTKALAAQVNQLLGRAIDDGNNYTIEMAHLLGVTLTPSPTATLAVTGTPTP
ncbi:MAG TPA: hypothetical protein VHM28_02835, partial [Anaerolineales bacterium]|nr:hypothetical protein [Anaerolineales bacterium]